MNTCPEFVQQATEGGFPWIILVVVALIVAGAYVWKKGLLGTATEGRIRGVIAKLEHDSASRIAEWKGKLEAKVKAKSAPAPASVQVAPTYTSTPVPDNAAKLAELNGMLISGKITLEQHALMAKLLA